MSYEKKKIALRHMLIGMGFTKALRAMHDGEEIHNGTRKDGITPEFQHQVEIALFILTLKNVDNLEDVICAALLHDTVEDYPHVINIGYVRTEYGSAVANAVDRLSKIVNGTEKSQTEYYAAIANCPIASIVKGCDRIHNVQTMVGVFSIEKQDRYIFEVRTFFLGFLKKARYSFPEQYMAYMAIITMLKNQIGLIEAVRKNVQLENNSSK